MAAEQAALRTAMTALGVDVLALTLEDTTWVVRIRSASGAGYAAPDLQADGAPSVALPSDAARAQIPPLPPAPVGTAAASSAPALAPTPSRAAPHTLTPPPAPVTPLPPLSGATAAPATAPAPAPSASQKPPALPTVLPVAPVAAPPAAPVIATAVNEALDHVRIGTGDDLRIAPPAPRPNPFRDGIESRDAHASRLARTLVSDIVAYSAEEHRAVLANGAEEVRTRFASAIERARENFYEQVDGVDVPRREELFRDALNAILANGMPWF